ncbi:MAG: hypothetical protein LBR10_15890 [Prevotellaceae bacterium]|jgi:hypothetical protein|nr:hypothetical protein [Prevotellaceae bacterium]
MHYLKQNKRLLWGFVFLFPFFPLGAQEKEAAPLHGDYKNEIGIDFSYFFSLLHTSEQSYLVNYKRHLTPRHAVRAGLSVDIFSKEENGRFVNFRLGYEKGRPIASWRLFYGMDASYRFTQSNRGGYLTHCYGMEPLLGVRYNFNPHFSLSTELKLNFHYFAYHDLTTFAEQSFTDEFRVYIGSVGMIVVSYHF